VHRLAVLKFGALAVVCFLDDERAKRYPDMLQYTGMWARSHELERVTFGFNLTNRQGRRLLELIRSGTRVMVRGMAEGIAVRAIRHATRSHVTLVSSSRAVSTAEVAMGNQWFYELPEFAPILSFVDSIFAQLNLGLLIYHCEDSSDPSRLRLIYANREASICTGTELQDRVGKLILEAFPSLGETDLPATYLGIINDKQPRRLGRVEYSDDAMEEAAYPVRAFPMPANCVGVMFERIDRTP